MEHAVALLVGKAPAELTLPPSTTMPGTIPVVPAGVSTTLLQRRPDIAAAERHAAAASANIGVAIAGYFPDITLSGSYGFASTALSALFSASSATWAYGLSALGTIFNGGATSAQVSQARANYDAAVAQYRQAALTAFQQVEDQLASLRILEREAATAEMTVNDARRSEQLALNQYKAGVADYTTVVTAETTRLTAEVSALNVLQQRLTASVDLVGAIGGGWSTDKLPAPGVFYGLPKTADAAK
jgi:NodT family efflux transporter outer membrane factor (OMF) lipoprotein